MRAILSLAAAGSLALSLVSISFAGQKKPAAPPKCSACSMTLSTKKTAQTPRAVKINGKTYYCCAACKMVVKK